MNKEFKEYILDAIEEDLNKLIDDISTEFYDDLEEYSLDIEDVDFWSAESYAKEKIKTFIRTKVLDAI